MTQTTRSLTTEKKKYKTDRFTLIQERENRWKVSGRDSEGSYRRIRFDAKDLSEAIRTAERILQNLTDNRKNKPLRKAQRHCMIRISDALFRSAESRNWSEYTRQSDATSSEYFLDWVDRKGLTFWHELRFEHVQQYRKCLLERGLAYDTIRLYLVPVRRTAMWMSMNWPKDYVNICQGLRLSRRDVCSTSYNEEEGNLFLPIASVLDFLDWLTRDEEWDRLSVGVALQGLAGLQLQEALRLTWDKVNIPEQSITIDGFVKNQYRIRKIPIVNTVLWILRRARSGTRSSGRLIPHFSAYDSYSPALKRAFRESKQGIVIKPKDLRNTIQTAAIDGGWYGYYVQRYVGHAPATIGERHYHGDQGKRLFPLFQEKVVAHIEEEIGKWKAPENSPLVFGPRLAVKG